MILTNINEQIKKTLFLGILLLTLVSLSHGFLEAQWQIINFTEHGTRRLVVIEGNRWYFYRPEPNRKLTVDLEGGKIMIKTAVREDIDELTYQVRVNNTFRNFTVTGTEESGDFVVMDDVLLNLGPGIHRVSISTPNRLAYFKVFREEEVWTVPTVRRAFTPERYVDNYTLRSEETASPYFSATQQEPLEFTALGPNVVDGFSRFLMNSVEGDGEYAIEVNGIVIETVTIPETRTGSYWLSELPEQDISIGRRFEFELPAGEHDVRIIPLSGHYFIFRLFMEVPEELPPPEEPAYDLDTFRQPTFFDRALSGLQMTLGTSVSYNDNVFSLSDFDMDRFDAGDPIFDFVETADDLIINPSLRLRYPVNFGNFTVAPYINANYYQYMSNPDKTNFSVLTALFNRYKRFNLNLYYGYYGDLYARDYRFRNPETGEPLEYERFEYEKNLYRLYSYFSLTSHDTPLFYLQVEDYFYNEFFTAYDGTATTYGLGWRRSFPTFYLRFFYYYRDFEAANVAYDLDNLDYDIQITDPSYESNIYDLEFRNKRISLTNNYDFRPYFGLRIENRYYSTMLPVQISPFQSTREENRYRITLGCEFYLVRNLNIILDYKHYIRNTYSEYENLPRYKDYRQNVLSLDFEYTINF